MNTHLDFKNLISGLSATAPDGEVELELSNFSLQIGIPAISVVRSYDTEEADGPRHFIFEFRSINEAILFAQKVRLSTFGLHWVLVRLK